MTGGASCAHRRVEYRTKDVQLDERGQQRTATVGWWQCDSCPEYFVPARVLEANGVATVTELEQLGLIPLHMQATDGGPNPHYTGPEPTGEQ